MTSRSARDVSIKAYVSSRQKRRGASSGQSLRKNQGISRIELMPGGGYVVFGANNEILGTHAEMKSGSNEAVVAGVQAGVSEVAHLDPREAYVDLLRGNAHRGVGRGVRLLGYVTSPNSPAHQRALYSNPSINTNVWRNLYEGQTVSDLDYIHLVREGVPAKTVANLVAHMNVSEDTYPALVGMSATQFRREIDRNSRLKSDQTERYIALANLIGQVRSMVENSGFTGEFDPVAWVGDWLKAPMPALGNKPPLEFMDTARGQQMIARLLSQVEAGAYA